MFAHFLTLRNADNLPREIFSHKPTVTGYYYSVPLEAMSLGKSANLRECCGLPICPDR
jgi:hypothetical protein